MIDSGVVRVQIPQRECDPRAHGALGDGRTDDTLAIQAAIDECASALGGTVALTCRTGGWLGGSEEARAGRG